MFNVYYFLFFILLRPESPASVALPKASPAAFHAGFLFLPKVGVEAPRGRFGPPPIEAVLENSSIGSSSSRSSTFFFENLQE